MSAYPGCTLQMKMLFPGRLIMVYDTREEDASTRPDWQAEILCFCPSIRSFVCYQTCEHDTLKMKTYFDADWQKWSTGQGHETINFGVRKSKVKVTIGERYIWRPGGGIIHDPLGRVTSPVSSERVVLTTHSLTHCCA